MSFLPISLGVRRRPDAGEAEGRTQRPSRKVQLTKTITEKTLRRDDYTCRFCGFQAKTFQHVISTDIIHTACDDDFVTACVFCEQCFMLERTGLAGGGILIWLPELTQAELNHLARAIYVARSVTDHPYAATATRAMDALIARRSDAKKRLGTDDPLLLATAMHEDLSAKDYAACAAKLDGIRLMPYERWMVRSANGDSNQFNALIADWRKALPTDVWARLEAVGERGI